MLKENNNLIPKQLCSCVISYTITRRGCNLNVPIKCKIMTNYH